MTRVPVLLVLGGVFALGGAGRGGLALSKMPDPDVRRPPPAWETLDRWSAELDQREAAIEAAGIAAEIEQAAARRLVNRARATGTEAAEPRRLAALYTALPPDRAAAILGSLRAPDAARILGTMPPAAAGGVLGAMEAETALAVSRHMPLR